MFEAHKIEELLRNIVKEFLKKEEALIPSNLGSMNYQQLTETLIEYLHSRRDENVATSVGPGSRVHRLEPLQEHDAWTLFDTKAFWKQYDHQCAPELQTIAEAVLRKCEGLPLAIVAIGGLMCSKGKTEVEWKKVDDSLNWQLNYNPILEWVKGILMMSFNDLPSTLNIVSCIVVFSLTVT
ncbi:hypothetical protein ACH5RR_029429 [Cinchona calisaya]|uniref:NB-ARC domain-containing protein n=1 Tax=Cinchona calisaya TaxID=153742 RepID=A0ABD2YRQ2_9GENT